LLGACRQHLELDYWMLLVEQVTTVIIITHLYSTSRSEDTEAVEKYDIMNDIMSGGIHRSSVVADFAGTYPKVFTYSC